MSYSTKWSKTKQKNFFVNGKSNFNGFAQNRSTCFEIRLAKHEKIARFVSVGSINTLVKYVLSFLGILVISVTPIRCNTAAAEFFRQMF